MKIVLFKQDLNMRRWHERSAFGLVPEPHGDQRSFKNWLRIVADGFWFIGIKSVIPLCVLWPKDHCQAKSTVIVLILSTVWGKAVHKRWSFCSIRKKTQEDQELSKSCLGKDRTPQIPLKVTQAHTESCGFTEGIGAKSMEGPQDGILGERKRQEEACRSSPVGGCTRTVTI